jgi:hypothetical protein
MSHEGCGKSPEASARQGNVLRTLLARELALAETREGLLGGGSALIALASR